jgi:ABC-type transporter MlaC component
MGSSMSSRETLTRRTLVAAMVASACVGSSGVGQANAADTVVAFMNQIREPLLGAAISASRASFRRVIRKYADISGIAMYSLGSYRDGLEGSRRDAYYNGVVRYMSHYFATMAEEYKVENGSVTGESWQEGDLHYVDSRIFLKDGGSTYNVRWELAKDGGSFKIRNVRVLGFWLAYFQRKQFEQFIASRGGSVNALVAALNP